jgi:hypothetical protein
LVVPVVPEPFKGASNLFGREEDVPLRILNDDRLDMSAEALVLKYADEFDDAVVAAARKRLAEYGIGTERDDTAHAGRIAGFEGPAFISSATPNLLRSSCVRGARSLSV